MAVELVDSHHTKAAESILIVMCFLAAIATLMMPFETAGKCTWFKLQLDGYLYLVAQVRCRVAVVFI